MRRFALALMFALICGTGFAQVTASGTGVQDGTGALNTGGQWCLNSTCLSVTGGSFSGTVTPGTQTVTVKNASSVTVLSLPNVVVPSGQSFNWNLYLVPTNGVVTATGGPYLPCFVGATWTAATTYYCQSFAGQMAWGSTITPVPSGNTAGFGTPTFICTSPCVYSQIDASPTSNALWAVLASPGTNSTNWVKQVGGSGGAPGGSSGTFQYNCSGSFCGFAMVVGEVPSGAINSSNTTFTLANTPAAGSVTLWLNGLQQQSGAGNDYTISGGTITMLTAPTTGGFLIANYWH